MIKVGQLELYIVSDGFFKLDGGAMFGIVPKVAWEKVTEVDSKNRIRMGLNTLLIRTGRKNILVDTGIGTKRDAKFNEMYGVVRPPTVPESLNRLGLSVTDIDAVVISHLHFDHAGGATVLDGDEIVPTFPRALYFIQRGMWAEALTPNPRTRGSYMEDDFLPLEKAGRVKFLDGDHEIEPGIVARKTGGHVKHHQSVFIESGGRKAVYWADLMPTTNHVKPAWVMGYDLFPHEVADLKQRMLADAVREEWVCVFEHDPRIAVGIIREGYKVEPLEPVGA
ncbi:MAG: MBL fold metallo-hydrolase [Planctomycetes bacterium]|nr:MBL fold metallo-hydrolase [Planctomycetota bacterium]